jgi:hypothetical protein
VEMFLNNLHSNGFEDEFLLWNWISLVVMERPVCLEDMLVLSSIL